MATKKTTAVTAAKEKVTKEVKAKKPAAKSAAKTAAKKTEKAPTKATVKKTATKAKTTAKKADAPVKETMAKKATSVKKETPAKKAAPKKPAAKAVEKSIAAKHFFEIDGVQVNTDDISARIRDAYKTEGHRVGNIKSLDIYYNFAERKAYYVINGKSEDKYIEF